MVTLRRHFPQSKIQEVVWFVTIVFLSQVIRSRSIHNRSTLDLRLDEFPITVAAEFLVKPTLNALLDAYLSVGGIPVYLQMLTSQSVYLSVDCRPVGATRSRDP